MTKVGVGHSTKRSAAGAAGEAARAAIATLGGDQPNLVLVFASPGYNQPVLLENIRSVVGPKAAVCGCSSEGIVVRGGCNELVCAITVMALASDTIEVTAFNVAGFSKNPKGCGAEIARRLGELGPERARAMFLFPDGVTGNTTAMLRGLDAALPFDCAGRARTLFGARTADAIVRPIRQAFGDTPSMGFFTFGEIAQIGTQSCYHNFTVARCALYDA